MFRINTSIKAVPQFAAISGIKNSQNFLCAALFSYIAASRSVFPYWGVDLSMVQLRRMQFEPGQFQ